MKASLIVYINKSTKTLPLLIYALNQQTEKDFEVVIAQDGKGDDVEKILQQAKAIATFSITHLSHNDGCYKREVMLNRAIVLAKSDYLIFIEEGTIPHHKFIEEHIRLSRYGKVVAAKTIELSNEFSSEVTLKMVSSKRVHAYMLAKAIRGKVKNSTELFRITSGFMRHFILSDVWQGLSSENFSLYKEDILSVNGFDERFDTKSEESDFDLEVRLMQQGVFTKEERKIATLYKIMQGEQLKTSPIAASILEELNAKNHSWTPYGIEKREASRSEED